LILLAGGTKDSRIIAERLLRDKHKIIVTTATEYGGQLISHLDLEVKVAKLDLEGLEKLANEMNISRIVDATHPYAIEISNNLLELSTMLGVPYYRYERSMLEYKKENSFYDLEELINFLEGVRGNILLTLGSNNIHRFKDLKNKKSIYIRVLPTEYAIKKCEDAGFRPSQIIGLQGPFTTAFNEAVYENYDIKYLVTKESGAAGGELEKVEAAKNLGLRVAVLKRPAVRYRNLYNEIDDLIGAIK
jgi:precorrin-6A/cobalt-precorrin-6A reductase